MRASIFYGDSNETNSTFKKVVNLKMKIFYLAFMRFQVADFKARIHQSF